jgi:predicted Zn-dependent protease
MRSTQYYPGAIRFFFEKVLASGSGRGGTLERLLSTHPLAQDRVDNVQKIMNELGNPAATETNLFAGRYAQMKKLLR